MLSACIEMLFKNEHPAMADRIRAAHAIGLGAVEFWGWRDKDIDSIDRALRETGLALTCMMLEPRTAIVNSANHCAFLQALRESASVAKRLGAGALIVLTGNTLPMVDRAEQHASIVAALKSAAPIAAASELKLLLEPLNSKRDHIGYYLDTTREGLDIVEDVGEPTVRLLYDLYHSATMGEDTAKVLAGRGNLVGYVHVADAPGRNEPGSGTIDWPVRLNEIRSAGYGGIFGMEFRPSKGTEDAVTAAQARLAPFDPRPDN